MKEGENEDGHQGNGLLVGNGRNNQISRRRMKDFESNEKYRRTYLNKNEKNCGR